jgi:hypothetical protein
MSEQILTLLRERTAFKPKPPEYELALAHVPLDQVGLRDPIEQRVLGAMRAKDESFVLVLAPPGQGKSSLLAWAAWKAAESAGSPRVMPVYVPVGHHTAVIDTALIVRGAAEGLAYRLGPSLSKRQREVLEGALATAITVARQPSRLRAGLSLPPLHGLSANVAGELGGDLTTLLKQGGWQGGPHSGLVALSDLARAHDAHLVVIVEDTDMWNIGDENMARRASGFFAAVRSLLGCPDVTLLAAVQSHWGAISPLPERGAKYSAAARLQFRELRERTGRVLHVPAPTSHEQARALVRAVLERRMHITLEDEPPAGGWCELLFSADAVEILARRCLDRSLRQALADVRDTFDHHDVLPAQITRDHIVEAMAL